MAYHRCQTGGRTWGQPSEAPPRAAPPSSLYLCLNRFSCPAELCLGCWSWGQKSPGGHGRNLPVVGSLLWAFIKNSRCRLQGGVRGLSSSLPAGLVQQTNGPRSPLFTDGEVEAPREM